MSIFQVGAVAFGFGCGEGIPAIYSSVPHSMCWIDWVMTCVPYASVNINKSPYTAANLSSKESLNQLTEADCRGWLDEHQDLKDICDIAYLKEL